MVLDRTSASRPRRDASTVQTCGQPGTVKIHGRLMVKDGWLRVKDGIGWFMMMMVRLFITNDSYGDDSYGDDE